MSESASSDGPARLKEITPPIVIAGYDESGVARLTVDPEPATMTMGGLTGVVSLWEAPSTPTIPVSVGAVSSDAGFAGAGMIRFGRSWIAPGIEGALDFAGLDEGPIVAGEDTSFHRTDTLDLGVVASGEAELELEDGQVATLGPGACFVITGMQHRWKVTSAVPFVFTVFTVGARRAD